jgi:hypothetical protein
MCKLQIVLNYIKENQKAIYSIERKCTNIPLVKVRVVLKPIGEYSKYVPDYRTYEIWSDQPWFLEDKGELLGYSIKGAKVKDFRRFYTDNLIESIDIHL